MCANKVFRYQKIVLKKLVTFTMPIKLLYIAGHLLENQFCPAEMETSGQWSHNACNKFATFLPNQILFVCCWRYSKKLDEKYELLEFRTIHFRLHIISTTEIHAVVIIALQFFSVNCFQLCQIFFILEMEMELKCKIDELKLFKNFFEPNIDRLFAELNDVRDK